MTIMIIRVSDNTCPRKYDFQNNTNVNYYNPHIFNNTFF